MCFLAFIHITFCGSLSCQVVKDEYPTEVATQMESARYVTLKKAISELKGAAVT